MSTEGKSTTNIPAGSRLKSLVLGFGIVILAIIIIFFLKTLQPTPPVAEKKEKSWQVNAIEIQTVSASPEIQLLGKVDSPATSSLRSAINADIVQVPAKEGAIVSRGETLVIMDDREAQLTLMQRKADVTDIEAQITAETNRHQQDLKSLNQEKKLVALAQNAVTRETKLKKSNVTSEAKIDQSKQSLQNQRLSLQARELNIQNHESRVAQLEARLARAKSQLARAELDVERTKINSPFDGVITKVAVSAGERSRVGDILVEVYDRNSIEIRAQIPNRHIRDIRKALQNNKNTNAIAIAENVTSNITLSRVAGISSQGGVDGIFTITDNNSNLVVGQSLAVILKLPEQQDLYRLPAAAIYGENRVYKIVDSRMQAVTVSKVGKQYNDNQMVHLIHSSELKDKDTIVTTQLANAISGLKVSIRSQQEDTNGK